MEEVEILVIGTGVIGLAIAAELSNHYSEVVVVEQENSFGRHTSSRNSEVIHSGIYYPQNSLKALLCKKGNELLYRFAETNAISHRQTGKLVVATHEDELPALYQLKKNGELNSVAGIKLLSKEDCKAIEPEIKAVAGIFIPSTGIIDTHNLMKSLLTHAERNDAIILFKMKVTAISLVGKGYKVEFANGEIFHTRILINSAGLFSDKIADLAGINTESHSLRLHWCKGEYFKASSSHNIRHLVYPLPDPKGIFLGIHLTLNLNNEIRFGPNAYYTDKLDYSMDEHSKNDFLKAVNKYIDIDSENLHPDDTGIRSKLQGPSDSFHDFYIREENDKGFPGLINLIGIESPGLTSALSIAELVRKILKSGNGVLHEL
ncbi:MAG: NAD(P)/FAD-dependent oxidoreductase [Candidatus Cloacimonetes bacterium]|nr:NAD(P)/FAD-dependent oxidoreductase [Candidatus Cloacimonadota bacterium]